MKKLYLILLMLLLLFIPTSINAVAIYQLDQPIKELDNYTLREVFTNRNMARPNLTGATEISDGVYRIYNANGITADYNLFNGQITLNGLSTTTSVFLTLPASLYETSTYTIKYSYISGAINALNFKIDEATVQGLIERYPSNYSIAQVKTFNKNATNNIAFYVVTNSSYTNLTFTVQIEKGSIATPYQVPTSGPYNQFEFNYLDLTEEQIQTYYDLYLEAVRFEQENIQASQDIGGYQNIFKSIINGVKNLMTEMGNVWQFLNAPIMTSDIRDFKFEIDWSWDLIGMLGQVLSSVQVLTLQVVLLVPSLVFQLFGIPIQVSILSLLFSNFIFLVLGWIIVKSFLI